MQQQVRLVFLGETLQGFDAKQVRRRVGRELGLDKSRLARLFSGRRIVLKRAVDAERAFRHVDRFARVGARLRIEMLSPEDLPESETGLASSQAAAVSVAPVAAPIAAAAPAPAPRRRSRGSRRRRNRSRWVAGLAFVGLLVAVGAVAAFLMLPEDVLRPAAPARSSAPTVRSLPARAARADAASQSAKAWPQLAGAPAQIYRDLYKPARGHKAFAAAPDGRWGWTGDAPSATAAVDAARAACEVGRLPEAPRCEVVSVDGEDPPRVPAPSSPSSAPR